MYFQIKSRGSRAIFRHLEKGRIKIFPFIKGIYALSHLFEARHESSRAPRGFCEARITCFLIGRVRAFTRACIIRVERRVNQGGGGEEREREKERATRKCACARGISKFTRHLHRSAGYRAFVWRPVYPARCCTYVPRRHSLFLKASREAPHTAAPDRAIDP